MAALREILAVFGIQFDAKPLEEGNRKIDDTIGSLKQLGAAVAGAFAFDKLKDFTLHMVEQADAIDDQASRLGLSTKALQEWAFAGSFVELRGEALDGIFTRLAVSAGKAEDGGKGVAKTLKDLGVNVQNADKTLKPAGQLFEETGLALAGMADKTKATGIAMQLFGRGNANKVLQLFKDGAPGIAALREEFEALGGAFDEAFIKQAADIDDQMHRLNVAWTTAKVRIAGVLLPAVKKITEVMTSVSKAFAKTSKDSNLVQAGFVLLGASGLLALNKLLKFGQLAKIFFRWLLPLGLALLLLDEIITFAEGGETLIGDLIDNVFGEGSSEKVRQFWKAVATEVDGFFSDLKQHPAKFEQDWQDTIAFLREDINTLHPVFANVLQSILDVALLTWDLITGNWSQAGDKLAAGAALAELAITGAFERAKIQALIKFAEISNAWNSLWSAAVSTAAGVVKKIGDALGGNANFIGKFFTESAEKLAGITIGDGGARVAELRGIAESNQASFRAEVSRRTDNIRGADRGPGPNVVTTTVNVTVPPGTPTQTANRVGNAAAQGTNRAAGAATRQRGGKS
jgi:hypothetical protein